MNLELDPEAKEELREFPKSHQKYIIERLKELKKQPTGHENSGLIRIKGREVFKYVMKDGSKGGKDYRAVYDVLDESVKVFSIFHRDKGYDKEKLSERADE